MDEFNGKFTTTPEYPNGTYAYFATVDESSLQPTYPYITFKHRNLSDEFNYTYSNDQSDLTINDGKYKRNVTHLGLNEDYRRYPLLQDILDSKPVIEVDGV